jgi:hypothetical protein
VGSEGGKGLDTSAKIIFGGVLKGPGPCEENADDTNLPFQGHFCGKLIKTDQEVYHSCAVKEHHLRSPHMVQGP